MTRPLLPGSTLGVLGGGQLGRMFAMDARRLGYRVHILSPEHDTPAGQVADLAVCAAYDDADAMRTFAQHVDVVTFEFENVPAAAVAAAEQYAPVRPGAHVLYVTQHRIREKRFLANLGIPVAPFASVSGDADLLAGLQQVGRPAVLKTATSGYDGKGQTPIGRETDALSAWGALGRQEAILEAFVNLAGELSVLGARGVNGAMSHCGPIDNVHRHHILDVSTAPSDVSAATAALAVDITRTIMEALNFVGLLCVEFFVTTDGRLLVNELAPRPHNSGHLTLDACRTSQFEQQLRAICGLPLGAAEFLQPAAMANLLGDVWERGEPDWAAALSIPEVRLHLYGKVTRRPQRKMGHLTALASTRDEARTRVVSAREALTRHR